MCLTVSKSRRTIIMENNKKINLILDKPTNTIGLLEGEPSDNMVSVCHENMRSGLYDMYTHEDRSCLLSVPGMTYCHDTLTLMGIMNIQMEPKLLKMASNSKQGIHGCSEFLYIINKSLHMNSINFKELTREQKEREWPYRIFPFNVYFMESDSINVTIPYRGIEYNIYMLEEQVDKEAYDLSGYGLRETTNRRLEYIKESPLYKGVELYVKTNINELSINADTDIDDKFILNLLFNMGFDEDNMYDLGLNYSFELQYFDNILSVKDNILSPDNTWEKSKYYYAIEDKEECIMHVLAMYIIHLLCHKLYDNSIDPEEYYSKYYFNADGSLIRKGKTPGSKEILVSWYEEMHAQVLRMISLVGRCKTTMINIKIDWTNRLDLQDYIERINDPDIIYLESEDDGYRVSGGCPLIFFRKHLGIINKYINPERYITPEKVCRMVYDVLTILYATDNFTPEYLYSLYDVYELNLILKCILYKYIKK